MPQSKTIFEKTQSARKILVVDLGFLGDTIHLLPALRNIKENYPESTIDVLSASLGVEILKMSKAVNKAIDFPLTEKSPRFWRHWDIIRGLRREKYDLVFNFSGADRTVLVTFATGAKWRVGQMSKRKHFWTSWLVPMLLERGPEDRLVYQQKCDFLRRCGVTISSEEFGIRTTEEDRGWARRHVPQDSLHLSLSASTPIKEWPLSNWIGLIGKLSAKFPQLTFVTTSSSKPRELERVENVMKQHPSLSILHLTGLPLNRLAAVLERCTVHLGADSGVLHLAVALGVPTISVFRRYPGLREWAPNGTKHQVLVSPCDCSANNDFASCETAGYSACLSRITPDQIFNRISEMI